MFPFTYKGKIFNKCTKDDSENGIEWCATKVDDEGNVVKNAWKDCEQGCPGTLYPCDKESL